MSKLNCSNKEWWTEEKRKEHSILMKKKAKTKKSLPDTFPESCKKGQINYWEKYDKKIMESKPFEEWPIRLIKKQLKLENRNICEKCSFSYTDEDGNGPFQFHHKDGNNKNWKRENIEILCLNCHWMTPNFAFKGRKHTEKTKKILAEKARIQGQKNK